MISTDRTTVPCRPNYHHPRSPSGRGTTHPVHRPNRLRQWLQTQLHHPASIPVRYLSGQDICWFLPVTNCYTGLLPAAHHRYHGVHGCLYHWLLLHHCAAVHECSSTVGQNGQSNLLDPLYNQNAVIRQRIVEYRHRCALLNRHSYPTAMEPADEQTPEIIPDLYSRTGTLVSPKCPPTHI